MTFLYYDVLWLLLPLCILLYKSTAIFSVRMHLIILMLLVLTLARPVEKQALQETQIKAKDIVIALDVSYSMRATDIQPSRYAFAKETIKLLLKKNPADNVMLIAFTTNPLLLSPPTTDHALIGIALETLNPEFILTKGTSLEKLFKKLLMIDIKQKHLILISDGGEEKDVQHLLTLVQNMHAPLTILALGSKHGTTLNNKDGSLLKDPEGNLVISRINPLLHTLVIATGGTYIEASSSAKVTADSLDNALQKQTTQAQLIQKIQRYYAERYQIPLLLAVLLFLILHTRGVKYLVILFSFLGLSAQASFFDTYHLNESYEHYTSHEYVQANKHLKKLQTSSLQSRLTLANIHYKKREFKQSIKIYMSIRSTSVHIKQQLYYNIANAHAQLEAYDKAKIYYTKALQLGEDADAKHNLALVVFLKDKDSASLGIAHPKSQSASSSKSASQEGNKESNKDGTEEESRDEDQPSSGSASGEGQSNSKQKKEYTNLLSHESPEKEQHPLGSKVYELINKGYIRETQPW